jgi:hypothetical protein
VTKSFSENLKKGLIDKISIKSLPRDSSIALEIDTSLGKKIFILTPQDLALACSLLEDPKIVGRQNASFINCRQSKNFFYISPSPLLDTSSPAGAFLISTMIISNHQASQ